MRPDRLQRSAGPAESVLHKQLFSNRKPWEGCNPHNQLQVFYAACQGLLYVLCYRLEQLMAGKPGQRSSAPDSLRRLFKETVPVLLRSR